MITISSGYPGKLRSQFPRLVFTCLLYIGTAYPASAQDPQSEMDLVDLSLEDLVNIQVTSVSRRSESLSGAPAAIYVISRDDILRSGVTSLAEALRLAPGVEVARNSAHAWSISIRGFNSDITNKLLVLIDGRSVYSPLYAGVFWDVQDITLEDVDRIEVIAGPGGTLWGANAVNGVINIITRPVAETQGAYTEIGLGTEEQGFGGFRYGGKVGEATDARAYFKYFTRDSSRQASDENEEAVDEWEKLQGGFRLDSNLTQADTITLQGDAYAGKEAGVMHGKFTLGTLPGPDFEDDAEISGANLLGRWTRSLDTGSDLSLQIYYDYTRRNIPNVYGETRNTLDVDFQHHHLLGSRNDIVWGAGFRETSDELNNSLFATFDPDERTDRTWSFFLQDKIELWNERLFLTLGSKFEDNDYSGFEIQPNARLTWQATDRQTLWAAVSRAVRIPSRLDSDLRLVVPLNAGFPVYVTVDGNPDFDSEELIAYEAGYRLQLRDNLTFDLATYYNTYDKLQTQEPGPTRFVIQPPLIYAVLPNNLENGMDGESYGATLMANWRPTSNWRLQFDYTYTDVQLHSKPVLLIPSPQKIEGNSPENEFSVLSFLDIFHGLSLYTGIRFVDDLPNQDTNDYFALDASLRWTVDETVEMSITGQNLTKQTHLEFGDSNRIERGVYGKISWHF